MSPQRAIVDFMEKIRLLAFLLPAVVCIVLSGCSPNSVKDGIQQLRSENPKIRKRAAKALGEMRDSHAVQPLLDTWLKDTDPQVRKTVVNALHEIGPSAGLPLIRALVDKNLRKVAAEALRQIVASSVLLLVHALKDEKDPEIRQILIELLAQEDAIHRLIAGLNVSGFPKAVVAKTLGEIGDPRAAQPLVEALTDWREEVRSAAADALRAIGSPAVLPLIDALRNKDWKLHGELIPQTLGQIKDPRAIQPLVDALSDGKGEVPNAAADALRAIGSPAVLPLIDLMRNKGSRLPKDVVLKNLGEIRNLSDMQPYFDAQNDEKAVRRAADALRAIGSPAVLPLIDALKDKVPGLPKAAVAQTLGEIKDPRAMQPLIDALSDEEQDVRKAAASALGKIGDRNAMQPLVANLKDKDPVVRKAVVAALGGLKDPHTVEPLIAQLKDKNSDVFKAACRALGEIGDARAVGPLIDALMSREEGRS